MDDALQPLLAEIAAASARRTRREPVGFWERLPVLVEDAGPADRGADRPPTAMWTELRRLLGDRRGESTRALFKELGRHVAWRVQAVVAASFSDVLGADAIGCVVREVFGRLVDGGLTGFHGPDVGALLDRVEEQADRATLRAAVGRWALTEARSAWRARFCDLLTAEEVEELSGDLLGELLQRSLGSFRGATANELYVYVRTMARRAVSRAARRRILHRDSLRRLVAEAPPDRPPLLGRPAQAPPVRLRDEVDALPLSASDQAYLEELLAAGGKLSALAEARGVTRGSVTKMVQRILGRLDALPADERERVGHWAEGVLQLRA